MSNFDENGVLAFFDLKCPLRGSFFVIFVVFGLLGGSWGGSRAFFDFKADFGGIFYFLDLFRWSWGVL